MAKHELARNVVLAALGRWLTVADIQAAVWSTFGVRISRPTAWGAGHTYAGQGILRQGALPDGRAIFAA
jgi:hypothetical protein